MITGANGRIGRAIAELFAENGKICVFAVTQKKRLDSFVTLVMGLPKNTA